MAQWARQYSGNTHETRQTDAELALREAVEAYKNKDAQGDRAKMLGLAAKVFSAREHVIRARLSEFRHVPTEEAMTKHQGTIDSLNAQLEVLRLGGTNALLREFGVPEFVEM